MAVKKKVLIPKDGRSKSFKGKTERHHIKMDDKVITLFRFTKKSQTKSRKWYARCWLNKKTIQRNLQEEDLTKAVKISKKWYAGLVARLDDGIPVERVDRDTHLFDEVAQEWFDLIKVSSENGNRHPKYHYNHYLSYKNYIQPFFKNDYIEEIDTPRLLEWQNWRQRKRIKSPDLLAGRLKKEYITIFQILQLGIDKGLIKQRPEKPLTLIRQLASTKRPPSRATFTSQEYKQLLVASRRRIKEAKKTLDLQRKLKKEGKGKSFGGGWERIWKARLYIHYYIIFLAHTGARPTEAQRVRHKDITLFDDKDPERCHLGVFIIGKRRDRNIISKYGAYFAYKSLCENICPNHKKDDLIFPTNPHVGLRELLRDSGLYHSYKGDKRDSKSFRHFYIMTALVGGVPQDQLIEQLDVSHAVLRDHYARHIEPRMFKENLIKVSHIQVT